MSSPFSSPAVPTFLAIAFDVTVDLDPIDFDASAYRTSLATLLSVPHDAVSVRLAPGSLVVQTTVVFQNAHTRQQAFPLLEQLLGDISAASDALRLTVIATGTPIRTSVPRYSSPPVSQPLYPPSASAPLPRWPPLAPPTPPAPPAPPTPPTPPTPPAPLASESSPSPSRPHGPPSAASRAEVPTRQPPVWIVEPASSWRRRDEILDATDGLVSAAMVATFLLVAALRELWRRSGAKQTAGAGVIVARATAPKGKLRVIAAAAAVAPHPDLTVESGASGGKRGGESGGESGGERCGEEYQADAGECAVLFRSTPSRDSGRHAVGRVSAASVARTATPYSAAAGVASLDSEDHSNPRDADSIRLADLFVACGDEGPSEGRLHEVQGRLGTRHSRESFSLQI